MFVDEYFKNNHQIIPLNHMGEISLLHYSMNNLEMKNELCIKIMFNHTEQEKVTEMVQATSVKLYENYLAHILSGYQPVQLF